MDGRRQWDAGMGIGKGAAIIVKNTGEVNCV